MKALKVILIILGALLAIVLLLGLTTPKEYRYERSIVIGADLATVYPHISSLGAMDKWSPWNEYDPNMEKNIEGTDGTVGAISKWEGNKDVGKGEQTISGLEEDKAVRTHLRFIEPWASECDVEMVLAPEGEGTKVTWAMTGENDFMGRVMCVFMDMDAMLGKDFEKGLAMLKEQVEAAQTEAESAEAAALAGKTFNGYVIETIEWPGKVYVGKRNRKLKWSEMQTFFGSGFGAAGAAAGAAGLEIVGPPSGVYFLWDEKTQTTDMMAAMPVNAAPDVKVPGLETHAVPATKLLHVAYYGSYDESMKAHEAIDAMIKARGLTHYGNVIEEYVTGPPAEADTAKWLTNIYYMVR